MTQIMDPPTASVPAGFSLETPDATPTLPKGFTLEDSTQAPPPTIPKGFALEPPPDIKAEIQGNQRGILQRAGQAIGAGISTNLKSFGQNPVQNVLGMDTPAALAGLRAASSAFQSPAKPIENIYADAALNPTDENMGLVAGELAKRYATARDVPGGDVVDQDNNKMTPQALQMVPLAQKGWSNLTPEEKQTFQREMSIGHAGMIRPATEQMRTPGTTLTQGQALVEAAGRGIATTGRLLAIGEPSDPQVAAEQERIAAQAAQDYPITTAVGGLTAIADPGLGKGVGLAEKGLGLETQGAIAAVKASKAAGSAAPLIEDYAKATASFGLVNASLSAAEQIKQGNIDPDEIAKAAVNKWYLGPLFHSTIGVIAHVYGEHKANEAAVKAVMDANGIDRPTAQALISDSRAAATLPKGFELEKSAENTTPIPPTEAPASPYILNLMRNNQIDRPTAEALAKDSREAVTGPVGEYKKQPQSPTPPVTAPSPVEAPRSPAAGEAKTAQPITVTGYRGENTTGRPSQTVKGRFFSPDPQVASQYGSPVKESLTFDKPLVTDNWMKAKEALGLPPSSSMDDLLTTAKQAGHDGIIFKNHNGKTEYVDLPRTTEEASAHTPESLAQLKPGEVAKIALDMGIQPKDKATNVQAILDKQGESHADEVQSPASVPAHPQPESGGGVREGNAQGGEVAGPRQAEGEAQAQAQPVREGGVEGVRPVGELFADKPDHWADARKSGKDFLDTLLGRNLDPNSPQKMLSGIDPELFDKGVKFAADVVKAGAHTFADFVREIHANIADPNARRMFLDNAREFYTAAQQRQDVSSITDITPPKALPKSMDDVYGIVKDQPVPPGASPVGTVTQGRPKSTELGQQLGREQRVAGKAFAEGQTTETPAEANRRIFNTIASPEDTVAVGKAIRATMETRAAGEAAIKKLQGKTEIAQETRDQITEAAKSLPADLRGQFNAAIRDAKTPTDLRNAISKMQDATSLYELRSSWATSKKMLDNVNLTKLDPENRAKAQEAIAKLSAMQKSVFAEPFKSEPTDPGKAQQYAARKAQVDYLTQKIGEAMQAAQAVRTTEASNILRDGSPPVKEPPLPSLVQRIRDAAKNASSDLAGIREQYAHIQRDYGDAAYDAVIKLATVMRRAKNMTDRFFGGGDPAKTELQEQNFLGLGYHNNAKALIIDGKDPTGIPNFGLKAAGEIAQKPGVLALAQKWISQIEPMLARIRQEAGLPVKGWQSKDPAFFRINLTPEQGPPRGWGLFGSDQSMKTTYDKEAFGTGEYVTDPRQAVESIIRKHLMMEEFGNLDKQMTDAGLYIEPSKVYQRAGVDVAMVNGKEVPVVEREISDPEGKGVMSRFVPKDMADAVKGVYEAARPHGKTLLDAIINAGTKTRFMFGTDVGAHFVRMLGQTGNSIAQAGQTLKTLVPWFGKRVAAVQAMHSMANSSMGEGYQNLVESVGADKGEGLYANLEEGKTKGLITQAMDFGHTLITGKNLGFDTLSRRVIAQQYAQAMVGPEVATAEGLLKSGQISPQEFSKTVSDALGPDGRIRLMRQVNNTAGYANRILRAEWINKLQMVDPFIGTQVGIIPNEISNAATLGMSPRKIMAAANRGEWKTVATMAAGGIMSGVVGTYLAKNMLNHAITGHFMDENDADHRHDLAVGGGLYWSNFDPQQERVSRLLGMQEATPSKPLPDAREAARGIANQGLETLFGHTLSRMALEGLGGHEPYLQQGKDGQIELMKSQPGWWYPLGFGQVMAQNTAKGRPVLEGLVKQTGALAGVILKTSNPEAGIFRDRDQLSAGGMTPPKLNAQASALESQRTAAQSAGDWSKGQQLMQQAQQLRDDSTRLRALDSYLQRKTVLEKAVTNGDRTQQSVDNELSALRKKLTRK